MLSLNEHLQIDETLSLFEAEETSFTDQQLDAAEFYIFKLNPVSFGTEVTLYDAQQQPLGTMSFEDADIAIAFIEDLFDLDPEDLDYLESYAWANVEAPLGTDADAVEQMQNAQATGDID